MFLVGERGFCVVVSRVVDFVKTGTSSTGALAPLRNLLERLKSYRSCVSQLADTAPQILVILSCRNEGGYEQSCCRRLLSLLKRVICENENFFQVPNFNNG
jgi:hypothetical protein